jgi:hypothetical protein
MKDAQAGYRLSGHWRRLKAVAIATAIDHSPTLRPRLLAPRTRSATAARPLSNSLDVCQPARKTTPGPGRLFEPESRPEGRR